MTAKRPRWTDCEKPADDATAYRFRGQVGEWAHWRVEGFDGHRFRHNPEAGRWQKCRRNVTR